MQIGQDKIVLLFDGYCNLCNRSVDLIMKLDRKRKFRYASLQGKYGGAVTSEFSDLDGLDSVVFYDGTHVTVEMDAIINIGKELGFPFNSILLLKVLPKSARAWIYRLIAKNRYHWFGKRNSCRLPTDEEAHLFLD